jgi:hypothetical protein
MKDLRIELQDLRLLFLKSEYSKFSKQGFEDFVIECKKSYNYYYNTNCNPKTYSQWVNGQIIALD